MIATKKEAEAIAGTLSKPGKMPCHATSIPASKCKTGAKLVKVKNSVCFGCYALDGHYRFSNVQNALQRRLDGITHPDWVDAMVTLITATKNDHFRWHDSGDINSLDHLKNIVSVCVHTPEVNHWLPTRDYKFVAQYRKLHGNFPGNLTVRLSTHMIDKPPIKFRPIPGLSTLPTSTVVTTSDYTCKSSDQGNKCLDCRDCWNSTIRNISYRYH